MAATYDDTFQYSINKNSKLSYEQRKFYEENGYLVIKKLVDENVLERCSKRFVDICEDRYPKGNITLMKDLSLMKLGAVGERLYNKAQNIVWDDVFEQYFLYPELLDYVESFTGPNIIAMHTMLINKPPDPNTLTSRHPPHQDLHYFPLRPANKIVAAWTAIERTTSENGCLYVIPGTHKGTLLEHHYPKWENGVNKGYHSVMGYDDVPSLSLHMEKGDTVFFHPLLIHGSGPNLTNGFRKAISCHYAASDCYYIDETSTSQENIGQEFKTIFQKKGYIVTGLKDMFAFLRRNVRGHDLISSL